MWAPSSARSRPRRDENGAMRSMALSRAPAGILISSFLICPIGFTLRSSAFRECVLPQEDPAGSVGMFTAGRDSARDCSPPAGGRGAHGF